MIIDDLDVKRKKRKQLEIRNDGRGARRLYKRRGVKEGKQERLIYSSL